MQASANFVLQIKASPTGEWVDSRFVYCSNGQEASHLAAEEEKQFNLEYSEDIIVRAKRLKKVIK